MRVRVPPGVHMYIVRYKQDGVGYYTEPYNLEMVQIKKHVLELLSKDLKITDIKIEEIHD